MARASIYAMPARYEPFGLSILEAGLSGCALVLGDIPSLREHWEGAAVFVAPDDRDALRSAIARLIDNPGRLAELGRRARVRGQEFTVGPDGRRLSAPLRGAAGPFEAPRAGGLVVRVVIFCHSLVSDWNHGNAHFLRGVVSDLIARGHSVCVYEPRDAWSVVNLIDAAGRRGDSGVRAGVPGARRDQHPL